MQETVESFTLDHTKVIAPFVRQCCVQTGAKGDTITKFDLRFAQPNKTEIQSPTLHTLEHLLAGLLREELDGIIDLSPMGCRTGFYLTVWGNPSVSEVVAALTGALKKITLVTVIPAQNEVQCGNYRLHDLPSAKEWAQSVLAAGISDSPFKK